MTCSCLAGTFIYPNSIVVRYFFWVLVFDALLYCICAFESDVYVCMFKEIGKLSDFSVVVYKCCPFYVFIFCCFYVSFVQYLFLALLCVYLGSYCSVL